MIRYGRQNPLRLALPALKREFWIVIPQRGGIWVGSDFWVTYGSPEDLIVRPWKGSSAKSLRRVIRALKTTKLYIIKGSSFSLKEGEVKRG